MSILTVYDSIDTTRQLCAYLNIYVVLYLQICVQFYIDGVAVVEINSIQMSPRCVLRSDPNDRYVGV